MSEKTGRKPTLKFAVVVRTNLDELPICLCKTEAEAEKAISGLGIFEVRRSADIMGVDYAGLVNAAVLSFVDGVFMAMSLRELPDRVMNPIVGTGEDAKT